MYDGVEYGKPYCCQMMHLAGEKSQVVSLVVNSKEVKAQEAAKTGGIGKLKFGAYIAEGAERAAAGFAALTAALIMMQ